MDIQINILKNSSACKLFVPKLKKATSIVKTVKMASKSNPPFRAEHLGSLLRPQELLEQRNHIGDKTAADSNLQNSENEAIKAIVKTQLDLGFRGITDGEYRYVRALTLAAVTLQDGCRLEELELLIRLRKRKLNFCI